MLHFSKRGIGFATAHFDYLKKLNGVMQLQAGLAGIGLRLSDQRNARLFAYLDENRSGSVDFREFMMKLSRLARPCDHDNQGVVSIQSKGAGSDAILEALVRDAIRNRFQDTQQVVLSFPTRFS